MNYVKKIARNLPGIKQASRLLKPLPPQGLEGIKEVGHRSYVGGVGEFWDIIGKLQLEFLIKEGIQPHHYFLDIACGSLRGGVHMIPYLEPGHYLGIEKESELVRLGIEKELGQEIYEQKRPQIVISSNFEFEKFDVQPDYALAQSLFTHLPEPLIEDCFKKLRQKIQSNGVFYATFSESDNRRWNPSEPHDHEIFTYTRQQIEAFGLTTGWKPEYIGDWNHPRGQMMVRYRPV